MPLKKTNRIVKAKEIKFVLQKGTKLQTKNLVIKVYINYKIIKPTRLLIIVSKKISKKAVIRNRIRRKISSIFSIWEKQNTLPKSLDITIIINNKDIITKKTIDISKEINLSLSGFFLEKIYPKFLFKK